MSGAVLHKLIKGEYRDDFFDPTPVRVLQKVHFEIVHGCNLRCVGCPISTLLPKVKRVSTEDFRTCLHNVDVDHVQYLRLFNFGEPLLHHDITSLLLEIPKLPYKVDHVEISTNGQYANWDDLEEMVKTGILTQFIVSCDGDGTPASYERLRPPAKWEKLIDFLEKMSRLRSLYAPKLHLITRTICTDPAEQERWRSVLNPLGWVPEFRNWLILPDAIENMSGRELKVPGQPCVFLRRKSTLYIDYDGTVIPCCAHPSAGNWGNLKEQKFNEVMQSSKARADMYHAMVNDRKSMKTCGTCEFG